jgi:hypothetical protein
MDLNTDTLEKQWEQHVRAGTDRKYYSAAQSSTQDKEQEEARRKVQEIKQLLTRFKAGLHVREGSPDYHSFARLLQLNDQL